VTRVLARESDNLGSRVAAEEFRKGFHLTITNVPGPQFPLYMMGRRLEAFYPKVPLVLNTALGIAIMSYDGHIDFGLIADYDAVPDLDLVADGLRAAIGELATAAGAGPPARRRKVRKPAPAG